MNAAPHPSAAARAPELLERDFDIVEQGLGRRPFERIEDAARRCLQCSPPPGVRVRLAAHVILANGSAARRYARAARLLEGGR